MLTINPNMFNILIMRYSPKSVSNGEKQAFVGVKCCILRCYTLGGLLLD